MSELPEERKRIYLENGLADDIVDYPDPTEPNQWAVEEVEWATQHSALLTKFFQAKENNLDSVTAATYEGYSDCVRILGRKLDIVATSNGPVLTSLSVKPGKYKGAPKGSTPEEVALFRNRALESEKLYEGEVSAANQALRFLAYRMTRAEAISSDIDEKTGYGHIVMEAVFNDKILYFIEHFGRDELGTYMSWDLTNTFPAVVVGKKAERPFLTTSKKQELQEDLEITQAEIAAIPVIELDEAELVRAYWTRQRAA